MGKKKGAKKGEDPFDEVGGIQGAAAEDDVVAPIRKSAFAAMTIDDGDDDREAEPEIQADERPSAAGVDEDDDDQFGGLMGAIKKNSKKEKKKAGGKKGKKQQDDDIWDELGENVAGNAISNGDHEEQDSKKSIQEAVNKDDTEPSKEKNGINGDESHATAPANAAEEDDNPHRVLTKKEKEKLKKEREKAKKKAEADAKKAASGNADAQADNIKEESEAEAKKGTADTSAAAAADEDGDEAEGDDGIAADKKKKKKKKKAADSKPETAATSSKKPSAALQALQARLAAQKKAEEEAKAAEEEAKRREEELERQEKEAEERKEAERLRKKEKEKAKKEQLKKEGKLLTPKQKAEKAAAEARMQAMIKSGQVKVDGLMNRQNGQEGESKEKKKVVYDSRKKKKGPSGPPSKIDASLPPPAPAPVEVDEVKEEGDVDVVEPEGSKEEAPEVDESTVDDEVKDEWDAQSIEGVKEDWDAESEDEETKAKVKAAPLANAEAASSTKKDAAEEDESSSEEDDSDDDSEEESSEDEMTVAQQMAAKKKAEAEQRRKEKHEAALAATSKDNLRSPICCIMGHVDTGKTSLLDKIRQTNVQEGEAGGITQQIGATYFPVDVLKQKIAPIDPEGKQAFNTPGLLVIDTPGHESFTNLRTRGSSLCNIAILVVDIMHGLEQQTLESIRLLRDRKTPFIVALNKVDRLYNWKGTPNGAFRDSLAKQERSVQNEFRDRYEKTVLAFAEQGLNAILYYENKNFAKNVSLVPTSAWTGEGIPDMLQLLVNLTQDRMSERLMYLSELECTVLEVKVIEGLGTTIDVILSNGVMYEGDKIVICGLEGPIVTQVRALLTPQPLKEMRVKGSYVHHKMVKAALGVKISAPGLEKAISGSRLLVCGPDDDEEELKEEVMSDLSGLMKSIDKSGKGVCVQSSTLGSLEALLEFLKQSKIPVNGINIGPVFKRDIRRCATMLEKNPDLAVMLCFDVTIDKEAEELAEEIGVKIFSARIIYHLFDAFVAHQKQVLERKQKENSTVAVWPCRLKILAVFAKRSPLILGCEVVQGDLRLDTPIAVKSKTSGEVINLGRVTSLEVNHKRMDVVNAKTAGAGVAVRIECAAHETPRQYGRHFTDDDELFSHISRQSIDSLKEYFWDAMTIEQKKTIKYLKTVLNIA